MVVEIGSVIAEGGGGKDLETDKDDVKTAK